MPEISQHSEIRLKERCGLNKSSMKRMADRAYKYGVTHSEATGNLKKWMDRLYLSYERSNNTRLYGDKAYLFHDNFLITVIQIPNNLLRIALKLQKKKEGKTNEKSK